MQTGAGGGEVSIFQMEFREKKKTSPWSPNSDVIEPRWGPMFANGSFIYVASTTLDAEGTKWNSNIRWKHILRGEGK